MYGYPPHFDSNQGMHFTRPGVQDCMHEKDTDWIFHLLYTTPDATGLIERKNGILKAQF